MSDSKLDLGFLNKCEPWLLVNKFFPSKVGGMPAWLNLETIPSIDKLKCKECNQSMIFLCQIYAPLDQYKRCFHRTLFVFICSDSNCWKPNVSGTIKVLRCQLPRENPFYDSIPPDEEIESEEVAASVKLCQVCGCRGPFSCGNCKSVHYCSALHQKIDWTLGEHKQNCKKNTPAKRGNEKHKFLLEEFDLVTETEELSENTEDEFTEEQKEERRMKEYDEFVRKQQSTEDDMKDVPIEEFEKYVNQTDDDQIFRKFKKRIAVDPDQVLRFERGGSPLWITNKHIIDSSDIPFCEWCQSPRVFEFQIMPQLLNSFSDLNLDWGTIVIYTCEKSCNTKGEYTEEFCYKQDILFEK